jgi:hypothetical protein
MESGYDLSPLKGKIKEKCDTVDEFARQFGISRTAMGNKLSGHTRWTQDDIAKAVRILGLENNPEEAWRIFFTKKSLEN